MSIISQKLDLYLGEGNVDWEKELKHAEDALSKYKVSSYKAKDEKTIETSKKMIKHWNNVVKEIKKALKDSK